MIVAGGSGFVGRALVAALREAGYEPQVLTRRKGDPLEWDARTLGPWAQAVDGAVAVINLTGETVAQKWTLKAQEKILHSRIESTRVLGQAIAAASQPPAIWVNASAIGFYGDRGEERLSENSPPGPAESFLVKTCLAWEAAHDEADLPGTRRAKVRIGFVCGRDGGGLPVLIKLARAFLGGAVGSGKQGMSWIHLNDLARLFVWIVEGQREGVFNGVAPAPVSNAGFMAALRKVLGRPTVPPAPAFALQLASAFGAPDPDVVLTGQFVHPDRALAEGFTFEFGTVDSALKNLV